MAGERFDTVIVGGGPAGALCAQMLAAAGWAVLLVERRGRNGGKACGHCLSVAARPLLARRGLWSVVTAGSVGSLRGIRVLDGSGRCLQLPTTDRDGETGLLVNRAILDQQLMDAAAAAGARIIQSATATVTPQPGRCRVRVRQSSGQSPLDCDTSFVIGADGLRSSVAASIGLTSTPRRRHRMRRASAGYGFSCTHDTRAHAFEDRGVVDMHLSRDGYLGVVQTADGLHMAGLVRRRRDRRPFSPRQFIDRFAIRIGLEHTHSSEHLSYLTAGPMPAMPAAVANAHGALIGDAAGYVEPLTGEGMTWALWSAELLASQLIAAGPRLWTEASARRYAAAYHRQIRRRQRLCQLLTTGLRWQGAVDWMYRSPRLTQRLSQLAASRILTA